MQQFDPVNKGNKKCYQPVKRKTNYKLENKSKAKCQLGNKAVKAKQTKKKHGEKMKRKKRRLEMQS